MAVQPDPRQALASAKAEDEALSGTTPAEVNLMSHITTAELVTVAPAVVALNTQGYRYLP